MENSSKGTRKDTPASLQMPDKLRHQIERFKSISSFEESTDEVEEEMCIQYDKPNQPDPDNSSARTRKPTPAYVISPCSREKDTSLCLNEDVLEEEEEDENEKVDGFDAVKIARGRDLETSLCSKVLRKDTPATVKRNKPPFIAKARSLCSQESIAEEDEKDDKDHNSDDKRMSYRLRKESILLCSHPSLDDISWKDTQMTVNHPR